MKKHKTTTKNWRNQLKVHSGSIGNMQQTQIQYVKRAMLQNAECEEMQVRQWTSFWRIKQMLLMSFLFFNHNHLIHFQSLHSSPQIGQKQTINKAQHALSTPKNTNAKPTDSPKTNNFKPKQLIGRGSSFSKKCWVPFLVGIQPS